jgi:hypothetical protein
MQKNYFSSKLLESGHDDFEKQLIGSPPAVHHQDDEDFLLSKDKDDFPDRLPNEDFEEEDDEEEEEEEDGSAAPVDGMYDPEEFHDLDVSPDVR